MLIKPKVMPADPTKVCRTCSHHDPDLHVCCANDYAIRDEEANTMSCSDWNPKKICITCGYFDPDTNQCWFEEHDMSEEESLTRTCESWEPRKEKLNVFTATETMGMDPVNPVKVPLQPDGSLKMQARETIGAETVNTDAVVRLQKLCDEAEPCKAKLTFQYKKQPVFGGTSLKELEEKKKADDLEYAKRRKALNYGAKQGMTLEALDTVFAIACQQVPSMEKGWMELKAEINIMFAKKWAVEDMPE